MEPNIVIVGLGPAGASTALHLAKIAPDLAKRTIILEKARHPRPKLCGGGILPDGERILKKLGLDITTLPHTDITDSRFQFEQNGFNIRRKPVSFRVLERTVFDAWLCSAVQTQGIEVQQETCVQKITAVENGMLLETDRGTHQASVVVGADGANSIIRKSVQTCPERSARLLEFTIPPDKTDISTSRNRATFDFSIIKQGGQGYSWDFPMLLDGKPARNQGIYNTRLFGNTPKFDLKTALTRITAEQNLNLADFEVKSHPIYRFEPQGEFAVPHILLTGDAAGVDVCFGEGISFALAYGKLAAQEIQAAFAARDFSFEHYKKRILRSRMGITLKRRHRTAKLLFSPRSVKLQPLFWGKLSFLMRWYIENFLIDWIT